MDEWIRRRAYPSLERFLDFHPDIEMLSPDWFTFMINATWIIIFWELGRRQLADFGQKRPYGREIGAPDAADLQAL